MAPSAVGLIEIISAVHDVGPKALGEDIDCNLQLALPSKGAEKVELCEFVDVDEVVSDETDQAERTAVINVIEKLETDRIESLGNVGRLAEPVLTSYNLEVRRLELYAYTKGYVILFSESPSNCVG